MRLITGEEFGDFIETYDRGGEVSHYTDNVQVLAEYLSTNSYIQTLITISETTVALLRREGETENFIFVSLIATLFSNGLLMGMMMEEKHREQELLEGMGKE